jgi:hypothetical protein
MTIYILVCAKDWTHLVVNITAANRGLSQAPTRICEGKFRGADKKSTSSRREMPAVVGGVKGWGRKKEVMPRR